jgi:ATP-dependent Zn protease
MTDEESKLKATAYHEAGHAVMAISLGRQLQKATIVPAKMNTGGSRLGAVKFEKGRSKNPQDLIEDEVLILLAGMVAESWFTGAYCERGAAHDLRAVARLLESRAPTQRKFEKLMQRMIDKTEHVLGDDVHRKAIDWVVEELLEKSVVSGRMVRHYLKLASQSASKGK